MRGKRINRNVTQWLVPVSILLVVFIVLLVRFSVQGKRKERSDAEEKMITMVQGYAAQMQMLLYGVSKSADSAAAYMAMDSDAQWEAVLAAVCDSEEVYDAVVCDTNGAGYRLNGESVNLAETEYFKTVSTEAGTILYVADDGISGQPAILVAAPVIQNERAVSYVLCYVDVTRFEKLVKNTHLNSNTFYMLLENSGQIG